MEILKSVGLDKDPKKTLKQDLLDWAIYIGLALLITFFVTTFIGKIVYVDGESMEPTLSHKDTLLVEKISQRFDKIERGDIVVVDSKENLAEIGKNYRKAFIIKRIIGVEGDTINIKDGKVFVNGEVIEEQYIDAKETLNAGGTHYLNVKIPEGYIYVLGDNRNPQGSLDSRKLGVFKYEHIMGRAFLRVSPIKSFSLVD